MLVLASLRMNNPISKYTLGENDEQGTGFNCDGK